MRERDLITACEATVRNLLRGAARFERETKRSSEENVVYRLAGGDLDVRVCATTRARFRPAEVPQFVAMEPPADCPYRILFTEYVTAGLAERLQEEELWFADAQGNAFLDVPGKLLLQVGGKRPPQAPAPKGQHFSVPGAKVLHYLLKYGPSVRATYRDIRAVTGVSIDKIGKLIRELEHDGALRVRGQAEYETADGDRLLRLWVEAYEAKLMPALLLGRYAVADDTDFDAVLREASEALGEQVVVGGEIAADALTGHLRPGLLRLYLPEDRIDGVRRALRLARSERGTIELCALYSPEIAGNRTLDGVPVADPAFVYAELMVSDDSRLGETALRLRQEHLAWTL